MTARAAHLTRETRVCRSTWIKRLLGHSQVRMTQRYAHLAPQTLLDAAETVAAVIGTGAPAAEVAAE